MLATRRTPLPAPQSLPESTGSVRIRSNVIEWAVSWLHQPCPHLTLVRSTRPGAVGRVSKVQASARPPPRAYGGAEGATRYTPKLAIQELNSITSSRSFNEHQPPDPLAREVPDSPARNAAEGAQGRNTTKASSLAALHGTGRCVHTVTLG